MTGSTITHVHVFGAHSSALERFHRLSVGIVIDGSTTVWGDCWLDTAAVQLQPPSPTAPRLKERITPRLVGQRLDTFRPVVDRVAQAIEGPDDLLAMTPIRIGVQQAVLAAVATVNQLLPVEILANEYAFELGDFRPPAPLWLDIINTAASAEQIADMISLQPFGLGYRLITGDAVESVGPEGEYLQQFIRELVAYLPTILPDVAYRPDLLLRLNGALGDLTIDPRQHIGKVLGHVMGLESAGDPLQLWVADPIALDDLGQQLGTLARLQQFMSRRDMKTKLIAETGVQSLADLDQLAAARASHGVMVEWGRWLDLNDLALAVGVCKASAMELFVSVSSGVPSRQLDLLVTLTSSVRDCQLVVTRDNAAASTPGVATLAFAEQQIAGLEAFG